MPRRKNAVNNIVRTLKKPTALDEVIKTVRKPKGSVPKFGLPRWKIMPLESKIPLIPAPKNLYNFSRQKIGKSIFTNAKDAEFNLKDPNINEIKFPYNSLHDSHLKCYFEKENIRKFMIQRGLITKKLDVKCTVKEYNMYRKYLNGLYGENIKKELQHRAELDVDRRVLEIAEEKAQKEIERKKIRDEKMAARTKFFQAQEEKEILKRQQVLQKKRKEKNRMKMLEMKKKEHIQQLALKSKINAEKAKEKKNLAAKKERQKIIKVLLKWIKKQKKREKVKNELLHRKEECKRDMIEKRWELRNKFQKTQLEIEKLALDYARERRETFIKNYTKKVNKERNRIKERINNTSKFLKCYKSRTLSGRKPKTCCRVSKMNIKRIKNSQKDEIGKVPKFRVSISSVSGGGRRLLENDQCQMTEKCKCDIGEYEICVDVQSIDLHQ